MFEELSTSYSNFAISLRTKVIVTGPYKRPEHPFEPHVTPQSLTEPSYKHLRSQNIKNSTYGSIPVQVHDVVQ